MPKKRASALSRPTSDGAPLLLNPVICVTPSIRRTPAVLANHHVLHSPPSATTPTYAA